MQSRHLYFVSKVWRLGGGLICGGLLVLRGYRERGGMMEGGWVLYLLSYGDGTTTYRRRRGWIEGEIGVRE